MAETSELRKPEVDKGQSDIELFMLRNPSSRDWDATEAVEAEVFVESGYVETRDELIKEYEPYLTETVKLAVKNNEEIIGGASFITFSPDIGFKTLNDAEHGRIVIDEQGYEALEGIDLSRSFEVGTFALKSEHRTNPSEALHVISQFYAAVYAFSKNNDLPNVLASFDAEYLDRFSMLFGPALQRLGPAVEYMKTPTVPVLFNVDKLDEYLEAINASDYLKQLLQIGQTIVHEP